MGHPLPRPHLLRRLRRLDLHAYGAQAERDTPEKNPSYGLVRENPAMTAEVTPERFV